MKTTKQKVKHTPGPWTCSMGQGAGRQIKAVLGGSSESRNFAEFTVRGDVPVPIFTDIWIQFESPEFSAMQDANAKLIAAAPELLEALQAAKACMERDKNCGYRMDYNGKPAHEIGSTYLKVCEAIQKATL